MWLIAFKAILPRYRYFYVHMTEAIPHGQTCGFNRKHKVQPEFSVTELVE